VISSSAIGSEIGAQVLRDGGNAIDAAVGPLCSRCDHPAAGNMARRIPSISIRVR